MSAKQKIIAFVNQKFHAHPAVRDALVQTVSACADNGKLATLWTAYEKNRPEFVFTNDPQAESGAFYDFGSNKITIKPEGVPLDLADMFLFESFNCAHRDEYTALDREFKSSKWPPMLFKDYGEKKSDIEGGVTFEYLTLLREIQQNSPAWSLPYQAVRTLKDNDGIDHSSQLIARMHWTPHDPKGTGDMRFPSPLHYAFQRVLDMTTMQAGPRIKYVILRAVGTSDRGKYSRLDEDSTFWNWWVHQWPHLPQQARPTALITVFEEANQVFQGKSAFRWRRIELADYQFDTAMEMEARRLCKRSSLGKAPGRTATMGAQIPAFVATRN
jgi:hypothetical protein